MHYNWITTTPPGTSWLDIFENVVWYKGNGFNKCVVIPDDAIVDNVYPDRAYVVKRGLVVFDEAIDSMELIKIVLG